MRRAVIEANINNITSYQEELKQPNALMYSVCNTHHAQTNAELNHFNYMSSKIRSNDPQNNIRYALMTC